VQYPAEPLKTEISRTAIPIARSLALELSAPVARWPGETVLTGRDGGQRHLRALVPRPRRVHPGHDRGRLGGPGGTGPERGWCL